MLGDASDNTKSSGSDSAEGYDHREVEWQFDAPDADSVERWLGDEESLGGLTIGGAKTLLLTDHYYDTGDWRLWKAGYALRIRSRGKSSEATLKALPGAGAYGARERREISEELSFAGVEGLGSTGPVGSRVRLLVGERRLGELFEIQTRRRAHPLSENSGDPAGELAVDGVEIPIPGAEPVLLHRVEIELAQDGYKEPAKEADKETDKEAGKLESFVLELREACSLTPALESKFGAGLRARELAPPGEPELGDESVDASLTLGEVAYAVMRRQFAEFLRHEPGVRLGEDAEEVHDMRVASRRLRAVLQNFEPALSEKALRFEPELKHFAAVLGEVRDLNVQLGRIETWIPGSPEEDRGALEELRAALDTEREAARERMIAELDSKRYERLVDTFSRALRLGPSRRNTFSAAPVVDAAPDLVRHAYRRVRKAGDRLSLESPAEDYHRLRKRCKRLRYLVESLEEVYGSPARKLAKRIKSLQDVLGELQDAEVAGERLRHIVTGSPGPTEPGGYDISHAAAFATGGVAARQASAAAELRKDFPKAYSGIKGKPRKRLEKAMQKMQKTKKSDTDKDGG
jgi:CHAD domain-containing protein